jgi:hypothetical protein
MHHARVSPERRKFRSADPSFALQCCLASLAGKSRAAAIVVSRRRHEEGACHPERGLQMEVIGSFNRTACSAEALLVDAGAWSCSNESQDGLCISIYRAARDGALPAEVWDASAEAELRAVFDAARAAALRLGIARATHERAA